MIFFNFFGIRSRVQEIKCDWRAEENQRGIVIRLSNKDHLNRPLAWSWRWLLIIGSRSGKSFLYHEQWGSEHLQGGFTQGTKGPWTFAGRFCAVCKRGLNACMTVLHVYKKALKWLQAGLHREQKGIERLHDGFARVQKGLEVSSWGFCTCTKGYWS